MKHSRICFCKKFLHGVSIKTAKMIRTKGASNLPINQLGISVI
jgi:hypothetical protein